MGGISPQDRMPIHVLDDRIDLNRGVQRAQFMPNVRLTQKSLLHKSEELRTGDQDRDERDALGIKPRTALTTVTAQCPVDQHRTAGLLVGADIRKTRHRFAFQRVGDFAIVLPHDGYVPFDEQFMSLNIGRPRGHELIRDDGQIDLSPLDGDRRRQIDRHHIHGDPGLLRDRAARAGAAAAPG
jgi:hypothetical protein